MIAIFDGISNESTFRKSCNYSTKTGTCDFPLWFNSNSFQTLGAWIVSNFEKNVWLKYYEQKKIYSKIDSI